MVLKDTFCIPKSHSCESRNPGFPVKAGNQFYMSLVPCLRRDDVWTPAFAGVTGGEDFFGNLSY